MRGTILVYPTVQDTEINSLKCFFSLELNNLDKVWDRSYLVNLWDILITHT